MADSKAQLRKELLPRRKCALPAALDISILNAYPEFVSCKTVFCYVSAHGEIETHQLISQLLKEKCVVVPYCTDKCGNMICVRITSPDDLTEGKFGIPEPKNPAQFPKSEIDFAIVPCIASDKEGYRLGYGKGYYDRFLSDIAPFKIGVCHKEFFFDSLPHDTLDVKMDKIIKI